MEGKPEAPERGSGGRVDESSALCPRVHSAAPHPMGSSVAGMTVDESCDGPNRRQIVLVEPTG